MKKVNKKLFREIAKEVESEWHIGGILDTIYYNFALEVAKRYFRKVKDENQT